MAIPYFAPAYAFGGSVTVAETIVTDLVAAGHDVTVATTDVLNERARVAPAGAPSPGGAEVLRFPNVSHRVAARMNAYTPRGLRLWLASNLGRFDVALLEDVYSAVSVMTARAAVRAGVPFALQPLGTLSSARERGRPLVKRTFLALWGRRTISTARTLMYCADHEAGDFLAAGGARERLVRMPLPLDLPAPSDGSRASQPTVAFVGRLHPIKRIDLLIEAIAAARERVPDLKLEVVGPGDRCRLRLEALTRRLGVDEAVTFHGFVPIAEKFDILRRAHVSALLSRSEGLPMAALESMACGTPVVLSDGCHMDEIDGRAGLVVSGTIDETAAAFVKLFRDDRLRDRLGGGAVEFARDYRREIVMPEMIRALRSMAGLNI
jgi:glycosyltransferase involved in cell wall biosynthesis